MPQKLVTLICETKKTDGPNSFTVSGEFDSREKAFTWAEKFKKRAYRPPNECGETWYILPAIKEWPIALDYDYRRLK